MRPKRGGGISSPPYFFEHSGPCIVAGNAWCLHDDLETARKFYPEAPVIAVNGAAREVKALALFSFHPIRFVESPYRWKERQQKFGNGFTVHGCKHRDDMPYVDHWWEGTKGGGGSAWGARKLAWLMGFDPVIFCGVPMEVGPYVGNHSLGGMMHRQEVIDQYRREIASDKDWHEGCYSASGWTAYFLGCLP